MVQMWKQSVSWGSQELAGEENEAAIMTESVISTTEHLSAGSILSASILPTEGPTPLSESLCRAKVRHMQEMLIT